MAGFGCAWDKSGIASASFGCDFEIVRHECDSVCHCVRHSGHAESLPAFMSEQTAISPTRQEDFPEWYQQVVRAADLAENSEVRGCMVIKPWGYALWERMQAVLDGMFKSTGHRNAYFPLFIPLSYLEKEAAHVEGFAKECAVVTHHRLESKDGKLVPSGELSEPLIVRPTSETIIGAAYARWVKSWRDLPILLNQWANVVRWELRPRLFLRTTEFLWQEGHTAHETEMEAREEAMKMLRVYETFVRDFLAIPVISGEKTESERFPGALQTLCIEAMAQDRKAIQAGTSHFLGQNFSKAAGIQFQSRSGSIEYAWTTSWGMTTRLIGALIMAHGDDDGLVLPPRIAPAQAVVIPITPKEETRASVLEAADKIAASLREIRYHGDPINIEVDKRDLGGGVKNWEWIKKGVPIRIEIGPRDLAQGMAALSRRDQKHRERSFVSLPNCPRAFLRCWTKFNPACWRARRPFAKVIRASSRPGISSTNFSPHRILRNQRSTAGLLLPIGMVARSLSRKSRKS